MTVITIPKHFARKDLVIIPREEYEAMLRGQPPRVFKEVVMTKAQKQAFERAERNFVNGKSLTLDVCKRKLGLTR